MNTVVLPKIACTSLVYIVVPTCTVVCAPSEKPSSKGKLKLLGGEPRSLDEGVLETFSREAQEEGGVNISTETLIPFWVRKLDCRTNSSEGARIRYQHHVYGLILQGKNIPLRRTGIVGECGPPVHISIGTIFSENIPMPKTHQSAVARAFQLMAGVKFFEKLPSTFKETYDKYHATISQLANWEPRFTNS